MSYFHTATIRGSSAKLRSLVHSVADIDTVITRTEADAVVTESKLIKDYLPRFNVLLRDDKRFPLLSIDLCRHWPRFRLCRFLRNDGAQYFGPYISSAAARAALEFVEMKFGLRRCKPLEPDAETHRHCLNDIIRFCSAPCIGKISGSDYRKRVDAALAFLRGERMEDLNELRTHMNKASEELDFEKAATLRDTLEALYSAIKQRAHITRKRFIPERSSLASLAALRRALKLPRRPMLIQAVDISNISGKHAVGSMVVCKNGICRPASYRRFRITTVSSADDAAMMAEVIMRHFTRLLKEKKKMPDLFLVDGGIVQLRVLQSVLGKLNISGVAGAGLAKRFEEIYVETGGRNIRRIILPSGSPALQLLQRIRDEAHRFAHAYHQRLRSRLMSESILDEIPGLARLRKQILLKRFGSLAKIAAASEEEIAATKGIGPALARKIRSFLAGLS
jgi:excinuclease ABC subunit C